MAGLSAWLPAARRYFIGAGIVLGAPPLAKLTLHCYLTPPVLPGNVVRLQPATNWWGRSPS